MNKYKIIDQDNSFAGNMEEYCQQSKLQRSKKNILQGR